MTVNREATLAALATVLKPRRKSLLKEKEKKSSMQVASLPFVDVDKKSTDDDINDVAAMGEVNLAYETQQMLGSTEHICSQIRSCKDECLVPMSLMQARVKAAAARHSLAEPSAEVANLVSHAVHERIKNLVEELVRIAQRPTNLTLKTNSCYEVTHDVKGQLKFIEELDRVDNKRREDSQRQMLLRMAKSRSKNENSERAKLKAKVKEMQRAELEEMKQHQMNLVALQAIGPRKKPCLEGLGAAGATVSNGGGHSDGDFTGRSHLAFRTRPKQINHRDMMFLMEQKRETAYSQILYRNYLK